MERNIPLFKPHLGYDEVNSVAEVLLSGWTALGPKTAAFEEAFSKYIDVPHVVGLNSCTTALDFAVKLKRLRPGTEVIVPTITFVSTAHAVVYNQCVPVFADVYEDTMTINSEDVCDKLTKKTGAIIAVHYAGRPADIDTLHSYTGGTTIIEDAAHACGASYKGRKAGACSNIGCFSFQAVKNLSAGDGGALALWDKDFYKEDLFARAKRLRWLGIDRGTWDRTSKQGSYLWEYSVDEVGYKGHMNDITAAIALVQLSRLDDMNNVRRRIAARYTEAFKYSPYITVPPQDNEDYVSSWHIYCIRCEKRNELIDYLKNKGISTGVHYKPIHLYSCYGKQPHLPVAEKLFESILSLPMYTTMTDDDIDYVIENVLGFYSGK